MGNPVRVKVKIFDAPQLALESSELTVELEENATTEDLLNSVPVRNRNYVYVVREGVRLTPTSKLRDGDEILVVPPIAGG